MARSKRSTSRLKRVQNRRANRAIFLSLLFVAGLIIILLKYGVPLLIQMAVFISEKTATDQQPGQENQATLSVPVLDALPEATPSAKIQVTGYGPANTTISLILNGRPIDETLVGSDGSFDLTAPLNEGENIISVQAADEKGNKSPTATGWTVTRDTTPPDLNIASPEPGSSRSGSAEKTVEVAGSTDPDASVTINQRLVLVSPDGKFSSQFSLEEGENQFSISAQDPAGNESREELTITWQP